MKYINPLILLLTALFISNCTFPSTEQGQNAQNNIDVNRADLIGRWNQTGTAQSFSENSYQINYIDLKNDSSAEILIVDSTGEQKMIGDWKYAVGKDIGSSQFSISVNADVVIKFSLTDNNLQVLALKLIEENDTVKMTLRKNKFKKDKSDIR